VRLHHLPEALNGGKAIKVPGRQRLRSLKPSGHFTLIRDDFRHGTAD
jgi:hypothetical protein